jgi:F0F1-type ATP synthase membrane subunit c/vacuolar-type H+-ATPase subunit K
MNPNPIPQSGTTRRLVWWILWAGILAGLVAIYAALELRPWPKQAQPNAVTDFIGLGPLLVSCLVRWLVLPRVRQVQTAFVLFILGLALAETCGLLGIFLSTYKNEFFVLGVLGLVQWVPLFARAYFEPSAAGFRPPQN